MVFFCPRSPSSVDHNSFIVAIINIVKNDDRAVTISIKLYATVVTKLEQPQRMVVVTCGHQHKAPSPTILHVVVQATT